MFGARSKSDDKLVRRILSGERDDFGELVRRYLGPAHAVAYAQLGNAAEAEDVVQEAFLRAFERLDSLREPEKFGAWLLTIARSFAYKALNKRQR